jgi:hypothetical protein
VPQNGNNSLKDFIKFLNSKINKNKKIDQSSKYSKNNFEILKFFIKILISYENFEFF